MSLDVQKYFGDADPTQMVDLEVQIIKLVDGTELIGYCNFVNDKLVVICPMKLEYYNINSISIHSDTRVIVLRKESYLFLMDPKEKILNDYERISKFDSMVQELLLEHS